MDKIKVVSLFSGIGAFEKALTNLNIDYELIGFSDIKKFAVEAYCALHNESEDKNLGDITKINEKELPDFDLLTYGFPCFQGNSLVLTNHGYKEIKNVKIDDIVLTHTNQYQKVTNTMKKYCENLYRLKIQGIYEINVTGEHPFYTITKNDLIPKWTNTENLEKGMYIGININTKSQLPNWDGIKYIRGEWKNHKIFNNISSLFDKEDFWYIVGRFLGDGWTTNYRRKDRINSYDQRTIICCNKNNNEINDIIDRLNNLKLHYTIATERTVYKIHITNKELTNYLYQFGKGAKNKIVHQDVINLPIYLIRSFLDGYIDADGNRTENVISVVSISEKLIYGISQCINKVYKIQPTIVKTISPNTCIIENRIVNQNNSYELSFRINTDKIHSFYQNGYIWTPYKKKEIIEFNDYVYNIEVNNDNSYTIYNLIVHNCQAFSSMGKREGFCDPERGQLFFDSMRIVNEKKPKWLIAENVRGLINIDHGNTLRTILQTINDLGYNNYYKLLNSSRYGVAQARERIFIVSIRKDIDTGFKFDMGNEPNIFVKDIIDPSITSRSCPKSVLPHLDKNYPHRTVSRLKIINYINLYQAGIVKSGYRLTLNSIDGLSPTLISDRGTPIFKEIRGALTGKERLKLQGFTESDYDKISFLSENKIANLTGNSITVNVVEMIFRQLFNIKKEIPNPFESFLEK